jgi:hypothetical protein
LLARGEGISGAPFDGRPFHALLRRAVADADVLVAWNALRILDQHAWADAAEMAELSDAFHPAPPPQYLYGGDTARAARIQLLLSLPAAPLLDERQGLTSVSPLPASVDQDPPAANLTPVMERKYEELRAALASSGWDEEQFFATYLDRGRTLLRFSNGKQYPADGHHRLAALFKAARDGFIPTTWLARVPFRVHALPSPLFEGKAWMTDELVQRALTLGCELTWDDVVPR